MKFPLMLTFSLNLGFADQARANRTDLGAATGLLKTRFPSHGSWIARNRKPNGEILNEALSL